MTFGIEYLHRVAEGISLVRTHPAGGAEWGRPHGSHTHFICSLSWWVTHLSCLIFHWWRKCASVCVHLPSEILHWWSLRVVNTTGRPHYFPKSYSAATRRNPNSKICATALYPSASSRGSLPLFLQLQLCLLLPGSYRGPAAVVSEPGCRDKWPRRANPEQKCPRVKVRRPTSKAELAKCSAYP